MADAKTLVWTVETADGTKTEVSIPSFRESFSGASPVPLDGNAVEVETATGTMQVRDYELIAGERTDEGFRFRTHVGQFIGVPAMSQRSTLVVTGVAPQGSVTIPFDDIVRITKQ